MRTGLAFAVFTVFVTLAEAVTIFVNSLYGLLLHISIFVFTLTLSSLKYAEKANPLDEPVEVRELAIPAGADEPAEVEELIASLTLARKDEPLVNPASKLFLSLSLAPLVRIVNLSMPLLYFPLHAWFALTGFGMLLASLALIKAIGLKREDIGLTFNEPVLQLLIGSWGIYLGVVEYFILRNRIPKLLALGSGPLEIALLALEIAFFTGFVEELVFRGVIQHSAVAAMGRKAGLLGTSVVFTILHMGWLSLLDMLFVFLVGLAFGFVALETGSIAGVSIAHGLTNVMLFIVMPTINLRT